MTLIAAAPPGPVAGQPGHFAHTAWVEASLKLLSLPPAQSQYLATGVAFTTTSWVAAGCDIDVVNPDPAKLLQCFVWWQAQATVTQGIAMACTGTGATTIGQGVRGEEARCGSSPSTTTLVAHRVMVLNPGTTKIRLGAFLLAAGTQSLSFWGLRVLPVGWQ